MSDQEILEKAIQKAIDGGWKAETYGNGLWLKQFDDAGDVLSHSHFQTWGSRDIIFNHGFAKALWGTDARTISIDGIRRRSYRGAGWQYHLMQMVIADDPIKYLGENLG